MLPSSCGCYCYEPTAHQHQPPQLGSHPQRLPRSHGKSPFIRPTGIASSPATTHPRNLHLFSSASTAKPSRLVRCFRTAPSIPCQSLPPVISGCFPWPSVTPSCKIGILPVPSVTPSYKLGMLPDPSVHCSKLIVHISKRCGKPSKPIVRSSKLRVHYSKPIVHTSKRCGKPSKPIVRSSKLRVHYSKPIVHISKLRVQCSKPIVHCSKPCEKPSKPIVHISKLIV